MKPGGLCFVYKRNVESKIDIVRISTVHCNNIEMNILAILLLGLAINSVSFASPIPQCGSPSPPPLPQQYVQNNGQPIVVVANNPVEAASDSNPLNCAFSQNGQSGNLVAPVAPSSSTSSIGSSAYGVSIPSSGCSSISSSDSQVGQNLAEQTVEESPLETLPQSDTPCKVETNTEVEHVAGETFVHHPGSIYINQPPTRLIINHPPFVIHPSPVVLNQAGRKVTKEYTKTYLPSPVQVRPIIVRVVKPIEQKVFVDKPSSQQPSQPSQSGQSAPQSSAPCLPSSSQGISYQDAPIELQPNVSSDNGSSFQQGSSADLVLAGCGCSKK